MEAYIVEWFNLVSRWIHFVTGIAWIGSSLYFVWLDNHLEEPGQAEDVEKGVGGELWSVHGGGFYHAQKYRVAPSQLPTTLHWFKWEAYSTWISGVFLLGLVYWYGAEVYLIDPAVADISQFTAVSMAVAILAGSWFAYDLLCRAAFGKHEKLLGVALSASICLLAWGLCQLYSGRGAYIHFGAVLGTIMVANVFFVIIPGQRGMVDAASAGESPDPIPGIKAKQRSVHNTYFTLPVLFVMTSNHYALTYAHQYNWLILIAIAAAGALVRVYFVARHKGEAPPITAIIAVVIFLSLIVGLVPSQRNTIATTGSPPAVLTVIQERCTTCHSESPTHAAFSAAPGGVILDTSEQINADADRIYQQTVVLKTMPIGNLTQMTDIERAQIDTWYQSQRTVK